MADDLEHETDLWDQLSTVMRATAYALWAGTDLHLIDDPEDFAQEVAVATWIFGRKKADEKGDLFVIDESFLMELYAWAYVCLRNRFKSKCRDARRRQKLFPIVHVEDDALEHLAIADLGQISHEQRLIYTSMVGAMEERMTRASERRIIESLKSMDALDDKGASPTALRKGARVSWKSFRRFKNEVVRQGIVSPRSNKKAPHDKDTDDEIA